VLKRNQHEIQRRAGRGIQITMVADLDVARARSIVGPDVAVVNDARAVLANPDIDIVIELIGGYGIAKALVLEAIAAGKHVVTANKALLAVHGTEIFAAASAKGVMVAFEAAVAGGIPIIKALREGLTANRIQWIAGIINGTTNFILSEMRDKGLDFDVVLKEAQRLGYAEADPTFDIEGVDAAHKVTLMSAIAFGIPVQFDKAYVEGITKLGATDIRYAEQLGYRIKLLGITKRRQADASKGTPEGIELRVHPSLVPTKRLIANVEGAMNAVVVQGDAVGTTLYYGKGAGSEPTASAVIADLVDITRLHTVDPLNRVPHLAFQPHTLDQAMTDLPVLPMSEVVTSYYLRLRVADEAGVLAKVTGIVASAGISIDAVLQREADEVGGEGGGREGTFEVPSTDLIILTHDTFEGTMDAVLAELQALPTVLARITRIRKEELN
jgi:homoserine dehydrogenase